MRIYHSLLLCIHVTYLSNIQAEGFKDAVDPRRRVRDSFIRGLWVRQQLILCGTIFMKYHLTLG